MRSMKRMDKTNYYLDIAQAVLKRGTCLRRNYGAIIVKNDEIISTGYCGAPRGLENCIDVGNCDWVLKNVPSGERYEICRSVHAELNAIISASRRDMLDSDLYLVGEEYSNGKLFADSEPCSMCKRAILNAGIKHVIIRRSKDSFEVIKVDMWRLLGDI